MGFSPEVMGAQRRGLLTSLVCNFGQGEGPSCNKHVGRVFKEGNRSGELKISQHGLALETCFECCVSPDCILLLLVVLLGTGLFALGTQLSSWFWVRLWSRWVLSP